MIVPEIQAEELNRRLGAGEDRFVARRTKRERVQNF
jgi:hypothetical protein